jgi:hypothetical protein
MGDVGVNWQSGDYFLSVAPYRRESSPVLTLTHLLFNKNDFVSRISYKPARYLRFSTQYSKRGSGPDLNRSLVVKQVYVHVNEGSDIELNGNYTIQDYYNIVDYSSTEYYSTADSWTAELIFNRYVGIGFGRENDRYYDDALEKYANYYLKLNLTINVKMKIENRMHYDTEFEYYKSEYGYITLFVKI